MQAHKYYDQIQRQISRSQSAATERWYTKDLDFIPFSDKDVQW